MVEQASNAKDVDSALSALMDGEADELELRRLLRDLESDGDSNSNMLMEAWGNYHTIRAAIRHQQMPVAGMDVAADVSRLLAAEPVHGAIGQDDGGVAGSGLREHTAGRASDINQATGSKGLKPVVGLAVAASVAAVVMLGGQNLLRSGTSPTAVDTIAANQNTATAPLMARGGMQVAQQNPVLTQAGSRSAISPAEAQRNALLQSRLQSKLQGYMRLHAEHASLNSAHAVQPYTRVNHSYEQ